MRRPPRFQIGQTLTIDGDPQTVVELSPFGAGHVKLRNENDGRYTSTTTAELGGRITYTDETPDIDFAATVDSLDAETELLARHLQELIDGSPIDPRRPARPEYSPEMSATSKLHLKLKELQAAGIRISESTLKRRKAAYLKMGMAGLIDGRSTRKDPPHVQGRRSNHRSASRRDDGRTRPINRHSPKTPSPARRRAR